MKPVIPAEGVEVAFEIIAHPDQSGGEAIKDHLVTTDSSGVARDFTAAWIKTGHLPGILQDQRGFP